MDLISQVKMADVMMKFLRGDMTRITPYPFTAGKPSFLPDGDPRLPRSTPEREGIPSGYLREFFRAADDSSSLPLLHSAAVLCHGKLVACVSRAPYTAALPHMTFSFSKTVVAMAVGLAAEEGLLSVTDKVVSFFPEKQPPLFRSPRMAALEVRHLLTMTSAANFNEAGSEMERDWVRAFFFSDCSSMPGEHFHYNSMNSYLLAAIVCRVTGKSLTEYLTPRLFDPLGIPPVYWETCPMGVEKGGWGLYLRVTDMAKLGELCLRGGVWEGKQILPRSWVEQMHTFSVETGRRGMELYGYQQWSFPAPRSYQFNGVFGQYAVVLPEYDMVIATTGGDSALFYNRVLRAIDRFFGSGAPARFAFWREQNPACGVSRLCRDPLPDNPAALRLLRDPWSDPEPVSPLRALRRLLPFGSARPAPLPPLPDAALRFCAADLPGGSPASRIPAPEGGEEEAPAAAAGQEPSPAAGAEKTGEQETSPAVPEKDGAPDSSGSVRNGTEASAPGAVGDFAGSGVPDGDGGQAPDAPPDGGKGEADGSGWYRVGKSFGTLLPLILAGLTNNFAPAVSRIRFRTEGRRFFVDLALGGEEAVTLPVGLNGEAARCTLTVNGEPYAAAVRGLFREDEDGRDVLLLDVFFLETPCVRRLKIIRTAPNALCIRFLEYPTAEDAAQMLLGLVSGPDSSAGVWDLFGQDILRQRLYGRMKQITLPKASALRQEG